MKDFATRSSSSGRLIHGLIVADLYHGVCPASLVLDEVSCDKERALAEMLTSPTNRQQGY